MIDVAGRRDLIHQLLKGQSMTMYKGLVILLAGSFTLAGCNQQITEGPGPAVRVDDPRAPYATLRYNSVVFLDESLSRSLEQGEVFGWKLGPAQVSKIAVETRGARRTETGTLQVFATFRNRSDFSVHLEGRSQFFDKDKVPVEGPTAWQRLILPPNGVAGYKEFATRIDAAYYYIEIREGR